MARRYQERLRGMNGQRGGKKIRIKIPPGKLPKPLLPPTREVRVQEKPEIAFEQELCWQPEERRREGLAKGRTSKDRKDRWTPQEERKIQDLKAKGFTINRIAEETGKTPRAVEARLRRIRKMGLM